MYLTTPATAAQSGARPREHEAPAPAAPAGHEQATDAMVAFCRASSGGSVPHPWPCQDLRRAGTGLGWRCADGSSGLLLDLCFRGARPLRTLSDGDGGFLPGVPLGCLGMRDYRLRGSPPAHAIFEAYRISAKSRTPALCRKGFRERSRGRVRRAGADLTQESNAGNGGGVPNGEDEQVDEALALKGRNL